MSSVGMEGPNSAKFLNNFLDYEGLGFFVLVVVVIFRKADGPSSCLSVCKVQGIFFHFENNHIYLFNLLPVVTLCTNEAKERESVLG